MKKRIKAILNEHDYVSDFFENKKNIDISTKFKNMRSQRVTTIFNNFLNSQNITEVEFSKHFYNSEIQIAVVQSHLYIEILRNPKLSLTEVNSIYLHFVSETISRELKNSKTEDENILNIISQLNKRKGG